MRCRTLLAPQRTSAGASTQDVLMIELGRLVHKVSVVSQLGIGVRVGVWVGVGVGVGVGLGAWSPQPPGIHFSLYMPVLSSRVPLVQINLKQMMKHSPGVSGTDEEVERVSCQCTCTFTGSLMIG